jgi:superfamily II DNA or RNA helicase
MNININNTSIEIFPYKVDEYPELDNWYLKAYTAIDKFSQKEIPCGYLVDNNKLYLPKGSIISKLESILGIKAVYNSESDPYENMNKQFKSLYDPRDKLQEDSIEFLIKDTNHQLALNLSAGYGKSFCVAYSSTELNERTIIITHNESIKQQWINTYSKMFNYGNKDLMNIAGSSIMEGIIDDTISPANVYFVNHQTLRSYLSQYNGYALHKFFKKLNVGIKVYDEAHLEFANIILIDFFSNTKRAWYLTATFDRSDKTESICFKRAFSSVSTFGEFESKEQFQKHVIYHVVNINSRISPKDRAKVAGYQGLTGASYAKYAFFTDQNNTAYNAILIILNKVKDIEGKILIFVSLIDAVDNVAKKIKKDFPDKSIGVFHSKIDKDEKESSIKKDIIISTIKSCGTGRDIPGLRIIISTEPIASKVIAEQMIGRLRPYAKDKDTYFFDLIDVCLPPCNFYWNSRFKKIEALCKEVIYLNIDK